GAQVGQFGATTSNTAFSVTLATAPIAAAAGGPLSLAIDPVSSDAFYITSRETATPPQLEVTVQGAGPWPGRAGDGSPPSPQPLPPPRARSRRCCPERRSAPPRPAARSRSRATGRATSTSSRCPPR